MSQLTKSIALLRHPEQLENLWLAYWNTGRNYFDFVTAERMEGDSFRESLDREVAWILDLRRRKDYIISSMARLHLELPANDSQSDPQDTAPRDGAPQAVVEFYVVDLYGKSGRASVELNQQLRWVSGEEVLSGQTNDGQAVSPSLVQLLTRADVITRHIR